MKWCLVLLMLAGCSNIGESLTSGAVTALTQNRDSVNALTRSIVREATTTATSIAGDRIETSSKRVITELANNAHAIIEHLGDRTDSSTERFYARADRTYSHALTRTRDELMNPATLRFFAQARDTVLGKPTQAHVQALVRVAFQEFRRQQDSTLKALESRSDTWQEKLVNAAAPVFSVIGALVILFGLILALVRALQRFRKPLP
jgi:hypothetical protein